MNVQIYNKRRYGIACFENIKINYWAIPKCGNTTLKYVLLKLDNEELFTALKDKYNKHGDINVWVHSANICKYITPELAQDNNYINFTVLRNPIDRLLSGYNDFMYKRPTHHMNGNGDFIKVFNGLRKNPSVDKLLDILEKHPNLDRDGHFRSQYSYHSHCRNIKLLKLENLHNSIRTINNEIIITSHLHKTIGTTLLSEDEIERIKQIYEIDFLYWNMAV